MSSKNVETLRNAHKAFSEQNYARAEKLVARNIKLIDHGRGQTMNGREEFRGWMEAFHAMSSDMQITDARYIDAGEWVIVQFRAAGMQDGPMMEPSFPASDKPYALDICELWRFNSEGEAVEGHNYSDGLGLMIQLGHIQPPA